MGVMDLIHKRKSVRRYSAKPIPREDLLRCVEAARLAPSACNSQPWSFVFVNDPQLKNRIGDKIFSGIYSMNKFAQKAAVLVVVVSERSRFLSALGGQIRNTRYHLIDVGIACEHLILQATELGIGSCWIGWFDEGNLKKILKIPRHKKVDVIISLGYEEGPNETLPKTRRPRDAMSSFNEYGGWGRRKGQSSFESRGNPAP